MVRLSADRITKRFGSTTVLDDVSIAAESGEVVALIGASGSGKSTLLRCLNLLERPDAGRITFMRGDETWSHDASSGADVRPLRRRVAMVFQHFDLWAHMTALDNVAGPCIVVGRQSRDEAHDRARRELARVGVLHRQDAYPWQLSGGEQQRVAIARALATEPDVLLFDEPTSALDPERVGEVLQVMRDLADEGRTMIVVTHEMAFAREVASRIAFLADGRIEEEGPAARLFGRPESPALARFLARATR